MHRNARAKVDPVRQRTQYTCMSTSMMMCLRANGVDCTEDEVNKVMGARPMKGARWEEALATAQHYGMRATLTMPSTVGQLKEWTDRGIPVMIAWNPEGRDWSHASVVFDVDDQLNVHVADPNIPDPDETVRILPKSEFYSKWYEKWPNYLVRRPAMAVEREITPEGRQVMASRQKRRPHRNPIKPRRDKRASGRTVRDNSGREWSPKRGLEGPFLFRGGRVLYYDPRENGGTYYDPAVDMYLPHDEAVRITRTTRQASTRRGACPFSDWSLLEGTPRSKRAEAYDCYQDYKAGGLSYEEYQRCLHSEENSESYYERPSYPDRAQWLYDWARIAELLGKKGDQKFIRSVASYVMRKGYPSPKQGKVLDRIRKKYRKELQDPKRTIKRLEKELKERQRETERQERAPKPAPTRKERIPFHFTKEHERVLEDLLRLNPGNGFLRGMLALVKRDQDLTEKQFSAIRHMLYKNRMRDKADLFRPGKA